jgi:hypothetical protein
MKMTPRNIESEKRHSRQLVLSIKQPWAQLIIEGRKDVEVRSWATPYRGPLWIHTGQKLDTYANKRFNRVDLFRGGIIGYAELWGIRPFSAKSWEAWRSRHLDDSPFDEELAKYGWIFRNPKLLDRPIPLKGTIGLFSLPDTVERKLRLTQNSPR